MLGHWLLRGTATLAAIASLGVVVSGLVACGSGSPTDAEDTVLSAPTPTTARTGTAGADEPSTPTMPTTRPKTTTKPTPAPKPQAAATKPTYSVGGTPRRSPPPAGSPCKAEWDNYIYWLDGSTAGGDDAFTQDALAQYDECLTAS